MGCARRDMSAGEADVSAMREEMSTRRARAYIMSLTLESSDMVLALKRARGPVIGLNESYLG